MRALTTALLSLLLGAACAGVREPAPESVERKIAFDLAGLNPEGLRGPADGKVAVAYEFKIPAGDEYRSRVAAIDPSLRFHPGSRGRIGAGPGEILCIGSTHQLNHRAILRRLAELPFVERIIECHFE